MQAATPEMHLSRYAYAYGSGRRALARAVGKEQLQRVRRGVHLEAGVLARLDPEARHVLRMRAAALTVRREVVFSHWSAAAALGLPVLAADPDVVHMSVPSGSNHRIVGVKAHRFEVGPEDVREVEGLRCTSLRRTVADLACFASFADAVAVADAALHRIRRWRRDEVKQEWRDTVARLGPRRSERRAIEAIDFANGDSGSVTESYSRVTMKVLRLPDPVLQHRFFDGDGFVGDTDFWFPDARAIGEADGRVKYFDPGMNNGDPAAVVYREKVREDRLRALSNGFARWDHRVARSPLLLGPRLAHIGVLPSG